MVEGGNGRRVDYAAAVAGQILGTVPIFVLAIPLLWAFPIGFAWVLAASGGIYYRLRNGGLPRAGRTAAFAAGGFIPLYLSPETWRLARYLVEVENRSGLPLFLITFQTPVSLVFGLIFELRPLLLLAAIVLVLFGIPMGARYLARLPGRWAALVGVAVLATFAVTLALPPTESSLDRDGDGVKDHLQLIPGVPTWLASLGLGELVLAGVAGGMLMWDRRRGSRGQRTEDAQGRRR